MGATDENPFVELYRELTNEGFTWVDGVFWGAVGGVLGFGLAWVIF